MTTQTPDAVREAAQEARDLLKSAQMASDGRRVTLHPTRVRLVSDRLAAALDSRAGDAGEGWKLVPVEPTEQMSDAGSRALGGNATQYRDPNGVWSAMLAAATPAPAVDAECQLCHGLNTSCPNGCEIIHDAVDAVPAGEVRKMVETLRGEMAAAPKRDWYPVHRDYLDAILSASLSHGEGRK